MKSLQRSISPDDCPTPSGPSSPTPDSSPIGQVFNPEDFVGRPLRETGGGGPPKKSCALVILAAGASPKAVAWARAISHRYILRK